VGGGSRVATWAVRLAPGEPSRRCSSSSPGRTGRSASSTTWSAWSFADHPDLRRLMMPENYDRHPLRRDLPANLPYAPWR
jgi:hypothetical protein